MNILIPDIETFKKVVKINASLPYESIEPYIEDALDIYIETGTRRQHRSRPAGFRPHSQGTGADARFLRLL